MLNNLSKGTLIDLIGELRRDFTALAEENRRLREALLRAEAYVEHGGDREGPLLRHIRAALSSTGEKG